MREKLLKAWLTTLIMWWLVLTVWWSWSNARLQATAGHLHRLWPAVWPAPPAHVTALNAWEVLASVGYRWSLPVLALGLLLALVSAAAVAAYAWARRTRTQVGHAAGDRLRELSINLGKLPRPAWQPEAGRTPVSLSGSYGAHIEAIPQAYRDLLFALLSYLAANQDAFVGPGHDGTLLDHSLHVLVRVLDNSGPKADPLLLLAALAHDAGKVLAWKRDDKGEWKRIGDHDTLSARLVSAMPEFAQLSLPEQRALLLALAYGHKSFRMPTAAGVDAQRLQALVEGLHEADRGATREEKKAVLKTVDLDARLIDAFQIALGRIEFQRPGIKKGARATGWRQDGRIYLLEPGLRAAVLASLPEDVAAALGGDYRPKGGLARVTLALLQALRAKGWLVEESEGARADPALWRMKSGEKEFAGVIAVDVPADWHPRLPKNTPFHVALTGPLFAGVVSGESNKPSIAPDAGAPGKPEGGTGAEPEATPSTEGRSGSAEHREQEPKTAARPQTSFGAQKQARMLYASLLGASAPSAMEVAPAGPAAPRPAPATPPAPPGSAGGAGPSSEAGSNVVRFRVRREKMSDDGDKPEGAA